MTTLMETIKWDADRDIKTALARIETAKSHKHHAEQLNLEEIDGVSHVYAYDHEMVIYPDQNVDTTELASRIAKHLHIPHRTKAYSKAFASLDITIDLASVDWFWTEGQSYSLVIRGPLAKTCTVTRVKTGERVVEDYEYQVNCGDDDESDG